MRKLFIASLFIFALFAVSNAQNSQEIRNMGQAPQGMNGIGRLDLRVFDQNGNPVPGVYARLDSHRTDGFFCQSWNYTDQRGVAVLPPIHMGVLKLLVKAKGYHTQKIDVPLDSLAQPVRVTLTSRR